MTAAKVSIMSVTGSRNVEIADSLAARRLVRVIWEMNSSRTSGMVCVTLLGNTRMISSTSVLILDEVRLNRGIFWVITLVLDAAQEHQICSSDSVNCPHDALSSFAMQTPP